MSDGLTLFDRPGESRPPYLDDRRPLSSSAKRAGRSLLLAARAPLGGVAMLPGFLIVGAQRCGTVSMARALSEHPAVFGSVLRQEVHYFDLGYHRSLDWYRSRFPLRLHAKLTAQKAEVAPIAFESSPYYMFHPLAAARIMRDLPG